VVDAAEPIEGLAGQRIPAASTAFAHVLTSREPVYLDHVGKAAPWPVSLPALRAVVAAFAGAQEGALVVAWEGEARGDDELLLLTAFAAQAGLAIERSQAREDREALLVLSDRERIARDLHDVVIQRLFATGLQLQTVAGMASRPEVAERVNAAVDDLDSTIRDIRGAIFKLRRPVEQSLRAELHKLVDSACQGLGFKPKVVLDGPIDSAVPDEVSADVLAVVREALSNVVRHSGAQRVEMSVSIQADRVVVSIADDGRGGAVERSGLRNLRVRAQKRDGDLTITSASDTGTKIIWDARLEA